MSLEKRKAGLCRYRRKQCRLRRRRVSGPPSRHVREDHAQRRQNRPPHPEGTPGLIGPPFFTEIPASYSLVAPPHAYLSRLARSTARRVGKECVRTCKSRWSTYHKNKKKN